MQIIIVGCGKVGRTLAEQLQEEESDITLIDVSSSVITSLQDDIDAMGIVHVSAKDLGTGKEQSITITASTNMSKDDIDKAVKDAEQYAAEDKKRREEVDVRNNADQMVFQTEKALGEFGDKVSAEEKSEVETKLSALKEALKSGSVDDIKAKQDDLQKAFYAISEKVYQQAAQAQGQQPGAQPGPDAGAQPKDDGAVDADFHEV